MTATVAEKVQVKSSMSSGALYFRVAATASLGHQAALVALVSVAVVVTLCVTIVVLVILVAKGDRARVVGRLAPVLERLADGFSPRRRARDRRRGRRRRK